MAKWADPVPVMEHISHELAVQISEAAELGLTKEEILEGWCLEWDDLTSQEKHYFTKEYAQGKFRGIKNIARDLTSHSKKPAGLAATMAYLRRFSTNFEKQLDDDPSAAESFVFNFGAHLADSQSQINKDNSNSSSSSTSNPNKKHTN